MLFENVIVLSEKGLEINNNNKENTYKDIVKYEIENNILLFHSKTCLYMYDTVSSTELSKHDIDNVKMIKMSECGTFGGALTYAKTLHIFDHTNILFKEESVDSFYLSKEYLIVVKECKICIYKNFELKETIEDVRDVYLRRDKAFFIVRKSKADKPNLIFYDLNTLQNVSTYAFDYIDNLNVKVDKNNEHFLLSFAIEHDSSAYYNKPRLYLYSTKTKKLQHIKIAKNPIFYDFIDNGMLVIHGEQPCDAVILNYNLTTVKSFPNGTRNRGYFNIHNNLICFAGFDNLNGTIEIYSNELLAKFKVLGASKIMWSKNGSYLIVAITNKLKVDNKVLIYDYFGRLIKSQEYDNLINVDWIGSKEPFIVFEKPAVKNIAVEITYVPPHLRGKTPQKVVKNKVNGKTRVPKAKEKVDVAMLEKELAEIAKLKEKMSKGENLEVKEMNMILKEDEIRKMIETNK